jgi:hypothetical protein
MALLNGLTAGGAHTLRFMLLPRTGIHRMSEAQAKRWLPKKLHGAAAASCLRRYDNNKLATAASREVRALLALAPTLPATSGVEVAWRGQGVHPIHTVGKYLGRDLNTKHPCGRLNFTGKPLSG